MDDNSSEYGGGTPTSSQYGDPYSDADGNDASHSYLEEPQFELEYNVYDRVGGYNQANVLGELGTTEGDVDLRDPVQRFTQFTKTVAEEMMQQGIIGLKRPDIRYIINQIKYMINVQYKNPTAFVLGFWVVKRNGTIDHDKITKLIPSLNSLTYPVKNYDVIRYANLWLTTDLSNTGELEK
jgi:hypothetical protein